MNLIAALLCLIVLAFPLLSYIGKQLATYRRNYTTLLQSKSNTQYLNDLYYQIWNGSREDAVLAWFRVKKHLENYYPAGEHRDELLLEVELRLFKYSGHNVHRTTSVSPSGRLTERTIIQKQTHD